MDDNARGKEETAMKAIKLQEPRQVDCVELEKPVPGPGQALVRIKTAGICGSDIGAFRGTNKLVCLIQESSAMSWPASLRRFRLITQKD